MSLLAEVKCPICQACSKSAGTKQEYEFYRCLSCAHLFVSPMPSSLNIYGENYFQGATEGFGYADYDADKLPMVPTFEIYLDLLERYGKLRGNLLDVGAATGFFLELASKRNWQVHGIEASEFAVAQARSKGLDVRGLKDARFADESFAAVTMWDVLEHMQDPLQELRDIHGLLQQGGLLAISTPDAGSLVALLAGMNWHLVVPPEHLNLFTQKSLKVALESSGYEVLLISRIGKRFTLQYVLQTLHRVVPLAFIMNTAKWLRGSRIGNVKIPINLHDNMTCIARKR